MCLQIQYTWAAINITWVAYPSKIYVWEALHWEYKLKYVQQGFIANVRNAFWALLDQYFI